MQTTIFGPPGTGKTTKLISIVKQELEDGTRPEDIAFVSFSRKAADEARTRASSALNMNPDEMVWFRTLHSMAFQYQGIGGKQVLKGHRLHATWRYTGVRVFFQRFYPYGRWATLLTGQGWGCLSVHDSVG